MRDEGSAQESLHCGDIDLADGPLEIHSGVISSVRHLPGVISSVRHLPVPHLPRIFPRPAISVQRDSGIRILNRKFEEKRARNERTFRLSVNAREHSS
jgi:hypothetical protein